MYFCVAGYAGNYSWWAGVGDLNGDTSWTGWQNYYSYSDTVTLHVKSNGSGYFECYLDGNLVYGLTDTAASQGYVGLLFYDGSGYSSTQFAFDNASLLPSAAPSMMGPDLFGASRLRPCNTLNGCSMYKQ
ncbi:MAG: hypothetical protein WHT81_00670 [Rectinemataceae bacterium]